MHVLQLIGIRMMYMPKLTTEVQRRINTKGHGHHIILVTQLQDDTKVLVTKLLNLNLLKQQVDDLKLLKLI